MKKYIIFLMTIIMSLVVLPKINAEIKYNNLTAMVDGINSSDSMPYRNASIKLSTTLEDVGALGKTKIVFAKTADLLTDTLDTSYRCSYNDSGVYGPCNPENSTTAKFSDYEQIAERSEDVYVAIYEYETSNYVRISNITKIERPKSLPITKRFNLLIKDGNLYSMITYDINSPFNNDKTFHLRVGRVSDPSLLRKIKNNSDFASLLTYIKTDSNSISTISMTGNGTFGSQTMNLNKSDFVDKAYYYIYVYRDTENGKYFPLEDVDLYQYAGSVSSNGVTLLKTGDSRFVWQIEEEIDIIQDECPLGGSRKIVKFETNGGNSIDDISICVTCGSEIVTLPIPIKSGYTFEGWYADSNLTTKVEGTTSDVTNAVWTEVDACDNETTLYAKWIDIDDSVSSYTITFDGNGGNTCSPNTKTIIAGEKLGTLCTPTRSGFTFNGWFTLSVGGKKLSKDTIVDSDMTIYAQWVKKVSNPKTGIATPIIALIVITILATIGYFEVKKRNISLE